MNFVPKVGQYIVRIKFTSKFLEPDVAYRITSVANDNSYLECVKVTLEGVEPKPDGQPRWFDPAYFKLVQDAPSTEWVIGAQVVCHNPDNELGWASNAAKDGETYTIKKIFGESISLEEVNYIYQKKFFSLLGDVPYVPKPKPKFVIYNQQASS